MADEITLTVNGKRYSGWKSANVTRTIEGLVGSFSLQVSERWANQDQPWPINEQDDCSIAVAGTTVITGFVDDRDPEFDESSEGLTIAGRDAAADLVDCSAILDKWEFKNQNGYSLEKLAKKLAEPFGLKVSVQSGLSLPKAPPKLAIDPGATAFEILDHACKVSGVLPVSDGRGGILLTRAGVSRCPVDLVQGENVRGAKGKFSVAGRFARYVVLGQHAGDDDLNGTSAAHVKGEATDPNVRRSARVLVIRGEGNMTAELAKKRAQWEATTRAAKSSTATVKVRSWKTKAGGDLWPVNALVRVKLPRFRVDGDMLITQVDHSIDLNGGEISTLSLAPPNAFKPEPQVQRESNIWREISRGV